MRIELDDKNKEIDGTQSKGSQNAESEKLAELIKASSGADDKPKFSSLSSKKKAAYIWDYYKWWIIGGIAAVIVLTTMIHDWIENSKPVYLYAEMLNSYLGYDNTAADLLYSDFVREEGIDLSKEQLTIGSDVTLLVDNYDTTMIAFQQRLIANVAAGELDVVIGPKDVMEGPANCDSYGNFDEIIPEDLKEELSDRGYEFYYFDPSADEIEDYEGEDLTPYWAGVYLDNCSYLNNIGDNGAYPVAEEENERVIFTITANSKRTDHAVEFLRFLTMDH